VHFLIDADLPRSVAAVLRRAGHHATDVRDIGLRGAKDEEIAAHARENDLCILTGDFDFADVRRYPPEEYPGIVVLGLPSMATASFIGRLLEGFLRDEEVLSRLPGRLAIVEAGRIRLRPA
jgi:predicted nuclease of predicted toxin-antitoxin system